jgi:hypothetical protein
MAIICFGTIQTFDLDQVTAQSELIVLRDDRPEIWEKKHHGCSDHQPNDKNQHSCDESWVIDCFSEPGR